MPQAKQNQAQLQNAIERLEEILDNMKEEMDEIESLVRRHARSITYERFRAYPNGHILLALDNTSDYLGHNYTLADVISEMENDIEETDMPCANISKHTQSARH